MTQILQVTEPQWLEPVLQLDTTTSKGTRDSRPDEVLSDRIRVARPFTAPIAPALSGDEDARVQAVAAHLEGDFHAVVLDISFAPASDESFAKVWIATDLTAESEAESPSVAFSMDPLRSLHPVTVRDSVEVSAAAKAVGAKAGRSEEFERQESFIEALNVGLSNPTWIFTSTRTAQVQGAHRMVLVVHSAKGRRTSGEVRVRAVVQRKRRLLGSYNVRFPDQTPLSFVLLSAQN